MSLILNAHQYLHLTLKVGAPGAVATRISVSATPSSTQFPTQVIADTAFPADLLFDGPPTAIAVDINAEINNSSGTNGSAAWVALPGKTATPATPSHSVQFSWANGTIIVATAREIAYSDVISIAMNHPPREVGTYGVKYFDGSTGVEYWDGKNWDGMTDVARYSGRPCLLSREEKKHYVDNILAGIDSAKDSDRGAIAAASALTLARHYATKVEKNRTGNKVGVHILNTCAFYLLAQDLGVNFDSDAQGPASATDREFLAWSYQEIAKRYRDSIQVMLNGPKRASELRLWLNDIVG
ncbi:hypothetical protein AAKU67_001582 [Oxalobacteraceae bacterium GrIS 2.11]